MGEEKRVPSKSKSDANQSVSDQRNGHRIQLLAHKVPPRDDPGSEDPASLAGSDSSEEIHYGPGFVSKLKSRYMSATLRHGTATAGIRRTASLEDFLDKDKDDDQIELRTTKPAESKVQSIYGRQNDRPSRRTPAPSAQKREKVKRCQSVEVLSGTRTPEHPPPLPPKSHIDVVLNSNGLANDRVQVVEKHKKEEWPQTPPATSSTVIASLRRPFHKRRSAGLLFGVEEKELPAPDTVKETRKIFEGRGGNVVNGRKIIKSKSTSSLYGTTRAISRSPSRERAPYSKRPSEDKLYRAVVAFSNDSSELPKRPIPVARKPMYATQKASSSLQRNAPKVTLKPSLPSKPGHLTNNNHAVTETAAAKTDPPALPLKRQQQQQSVVENTENANNRNIIIAPVLKEDTTSSSSSKISFDNKTLNNNNNANIKEPSSRQIGVIKPITRDNVTQLSAAAAASRPTTPKTLNTFNHTSSRKTNDANKDEKKESSETEVLLIDKSELPPVIPLSFLNSSANKSGTVSSQQQSSTSLSKKPLATTTTTTAVAKPAVVITEEKPKHLKNGAAQVRNNETTDITNPVITNGTTKSNNCFCDDITLDANSNDKQQHNGTFDNKDIIIMNGDETAETDAKNNNINYRESWKKRQEQQKNTIVFNFVNTERDVTHIENDGLDLSKRNKKHHIHLAKGPGVILLEGGTSAESGDGRDSDSDSGLGATVRPCAVTFVGANVITGKSSLRSKPKTQKLSITFSESLTQVFEYPSFESVISPPLLGGKEKTGINSNIIGGLGSYTPSKIQMNGDSPFQLGVSRSVPNVHHNTKDLKNVSPGKKNESTEVLRPIEDAVSWSGSSSSSDMLF